MCVYLCSTRVLLRDLLQPVLLVQRTGSIDFTLQGLVQTELLLEATIDPEVAQKAKFVFSLSKHWLTIITLVYSNSELKSSWSFSLSGSLLNWKAATNDWSMLSTSLLNILSTDQIVVPFFVWFSRAFQREIFRGLRLKKTCFLLASVASTHFSNRFKANNFEIIRSKWVCSSQCCLGG